MCHYFVKFCMLELDPKRGVCRVCIVDWLRDDAFIAEAALAG